MEKMVLRRTFNGSLSQQPSLNPMEPSFSYKIAPTRNNPKDPSMDDCEISIFDAQKYFNEVNVEQIKPESKTSSQANNKAQNDLEIMSERCDDLSSVPRFSSVSSIDSSYSCKNYRANNARSFHATPTASSEASWNSQTGLLSHPPGSMKVSLRNVSTTAAATYEKKKNVSRSRWILCPCSGKKSVQVEENSAQPNASIHPENVSAPKKLAAKSLENVVEKQTNKSEKSLVLGTDQLSPEVIPNSHNFFPENHFPASQTHRVVASGKSFNESTGFSFPILNSNPSDQMKLILNRIPPSTIPISEETPRNSLEVFQPPAELISRKSSEFQQRETRRSFTFPNSPKSRADDDVLSDASSDLFELESFSTQTTTTCPIYRRRDSLEAAEDESASSINIRRLAAANGMFYYNPTVSSIAQTECYEPSEASIDWSVTTAEGFDRASVTNMSVTTTAETDENRVSGGVGGGGGAGGGAGGWYGLLSCRCEKAVNVGPDNGHIRVGLNQNGPSVVSSTIAKHVNCRPPPPQPPATTSWNKPPLSLSTAHSARLFLPFTT